MLKIKNFISLALATLFFPLSIHAELSFVDVSLETLSSVVSAEIQESIILDVNSDQTFTLTVADPLNKNKILKTFESALAAKDLVIIEKKDHLLITSKDQIQQNISTTSSLNVGARQYIYPVQYYSADSLVLFLKQFFDEYNYLKASSFNNLISFVGTQEEYDRFKELVSQFDVQPEQELIQINLSYINPIELKQILDELIKGNQWMLGPDNNISIIAQPSQKQILISGSKASIKMIEALVTDLDQPTASTAPEELIANNLVGSTEVINLKYSMAVQLVEILNELLIGKISEIDGTTISQLSIQANPNLNQILLRGDQELREEAKLIIQSMDQPVKQVYVEAIVAEISESAARQLGVQFQGADSANGVGVSLIADQSNATNLIGEAGTALVSSGAGIIFGQGAGSITDLGVLFNFLKSDGDSQILATPSLMTKNNTSSSILVGQNVPIITGKYTENQDQSNSPFQTITRQDIGIILKIQPNVGSDGLIDLVISQEVSEVDTSSAVNTDVVTTKRAIDTSAVVQSGDVLAIGGLITETSQYNTSKFPILGDIPGLKYLFSQTRESNIRRNLVIFIKPTLVEEVFIQELTKEKLQSLRMNQKLLIDQNIGQLSYPPLPELK